MVGRGVGRGEEKRNVGRGEERGSERREEKRRAEGGQEERRGGGENIKYKLKSDTSRLRARLLLFLIFFIFQEK